MVGFFSKIPNNLINFFLYGSSVKVTIIYVRVFLAAGHYTIYQPDGNFKNPHTTDEFRISEQFILNNNINRLKLEHRYSLEQRFTAAG